MMARQPSVPNLMGVDVAADLESDWICWGMLREVYAMAEVRQEPYWHLYWYFKRAPRADFCGAALGATSQFCRRPESDCAGKSAGRRASPRQPGRGHQRRRRTF